MNMEKQEDEEDEESAEYYYRLICLVIDLGTEVLLKLFCKDIPDGQTIEAFFQSKANVLSMLKKKKVFNDHQIQILDAASPDISRFDISLLYILISNLTKIQQPNGGWIINNPIPSDQSAGAQLIHLRNVRNEAIAHSPRGTMRKSDFQRYWNEVKDILIELAGEISEECKDWIQLEINKIEVKPLVGDISKKVEALLQWARHDQHCEILSSLEEVSKKDDQQIKDLEDVKVSVQTIADHQTKLNSSVQTIADQQTKLNSTIETIADQVKTNADQLKTISHQRRPIPGTSSETESSLSEMIYTRPKKRDAGLAPDLENNEYEEYLKAKQKLQRELIDHYINDRCMTIAVPALVDGGVHIEKIFVMPSMRVRNNGTDCRTCMQEGSKTTLHELFQEDKQSIRRFCISGDAGRGKTTLCRNIVSNWCKVHSNVENEPDTEFQFLKSFDLLLYLPLRDYNNTSNVIEMVKTGIVRKIMHKALEEFLEKESEKCLIILDGLDEWMPSKDKVPSFDLREKFTVLFTSRPWKLEVLRPTPSEIGQEVELNGIENDKLIEAVVDHLNKKIAKKGVERNWNDFKYRANTNDGVIFKKMNETYAKLKHLAEVPIILTQMVCMWFDNKEIGNTCVKIYIQMLEYLFQVAGRRNQDTCNLPQISINSLLVNLFEDFKYCKMYSEILFKLSDLAYHTLFNEKRENSLVFPHSDTEIHKLGEQEVEFCLNVGILSQTKSYSEASSDTKSISYLHKTYQEFLAALYIASDEKDGNFNAMLEKLKSLDDVFEMSQVLIFLTGLRPDLLGDMSHHIALLTDKDELHLQDRKSIWNENVHIIDCVQDIIYNCIAEVPEHIMLNTKVVLCDVNLNVYEGKKDIIPYLDLKYAKSLHLGCDEYSEDVDCVKLSKLISGEVSETKLKDLVKLDIYMESQEDIDLASKIVQRSSSSLTCLGLTDFDDSFVNIDNFLTALQKVSHLTCVEFHGLNLTHSEIEYLGTTLSQSIQLKEIQLYSIKCTTCQMKPCKYTIDLSHNKQLQYLDIWSVEGDIVLSNEAPVEFCRIQMVKCEVAILDTLKSSTTLHELKVQLLLPCSITSTTTTNKDEEIKILIDVIPTLKNLRKLQLIGIDFKQYILRLSPEMISLREVDIQDSTMTLQCLQGFIEILEQAQLQIDTFNYDESFIDKSEYSISLHAFTVNDFSRGELQQLYPSSITSSTTTNKDEEMEVHTSPLCIYNLLTDVIPTLKNLRVLKLRRIDFKQYILILSPEMISLRKVDIQESTMTLQCLQGIIEILQQAQLQIDTFDYEQSFINKFEYSISLHAFTVNDFSRGELQQLYPSSITSSTTTNKDEEMEVHTSPLCIYNLLTDVIPTLKNLRVLKLRRIDFKKYILRLSPEMMSLGKVDIRYSTMTVPCVKGFIDSLPQTQFNVVMEYVSIQPREDTPTALKYITDRHKIAPYWNGQDIIKDGVFLLKFTNRPSH